MSQPKLIKGRKYVITGAADDQQLKEMTKRGGVKFPQTVLFNGVHFEVKDSDGVCKWDVSFFTYKAEKPGQTIKEMLRTIADEHNKREGDSNPHVDFLMNQ